MSTWTDGYAAGSASGISDQRDEQADTYRRNPHHDGPQPPDLPTEQRAEWVDGFLCGYGDLRGVS